MLENKWGGDSGVVSAADMVYEERSSTCRTLLAAETQGVRKGPTVDGLEQEAGLK